jgi:hypothetical protein
MVVELGGEAGNTTFCVIDSGLARNKVTVNKKFPFSHNLKLYLPPGRKGLLNVILQLLTRSHKVDPHLLNPLFSALSIIYNYMGEDR